ncbi:MAG: preprotein translocase subunit YajC [Treponema sp.]|nr:preprotein translocase subunit YajC [Treponema sp.]
MLFNSLLLQAAEPLAGGGFGMLMPLILIVIIMYFFMIRPQSKKQKELQKMLDALQKGDKVVTIGGIHGTVSSVKKEAGTVIIKVDDNTKIEFNRSAVASVISDKPAEEKKAEKKLLFGRKNKEEKAEPAGSEPEEKKDE